MNQKKLAQLENNLVELELFKQNYTIDDVRSNTHYQWALRYGFLESMQIIVDIACHLSVSQNLGQPSSYAECIELLSRFKIIPEQLKERLIGMTGLRNLLVHEYLKVDVEKLYGLLDRLDDIREFLQAVKDQ